MQGRRGFRGRLSLCYRPKRKEWRRHIVSRLICFCVESPTINVDINVALNFLESIDRQVELCKFKYRCGALLIPSPIIQFHR